MRDLAALVLLGSAAVTAAVASQSTEPAQKVDARTLFAQKGCAYCHGADASGTEKAPSLRSIGRTWDQARIERQICEGGAAMPAFGDALDPQELDTLGKYLASMKEPVPSKPHGKVSAK